LPSVSVSEHGLASTASGRFRLTTRLALGPPLTPMSWPAMGPPTRCHGDSSEGKGGRGDPSAKARRVFRTSYCRTSSCLKRLP